MSASIGTSGVATGDTDGTSSIATSSETRIAGIGTSVVVATSNVDAGMSGVAASAMSERPRDERP